MTIDITIVAIVLLPIMDFFKNYIFLYVFQDFLTSQSIDASDSNSIMQAIRTPEFANYITTSISITYVSILFAINSIFLGAYFIILWYKFGTTPGKILMRMKIVDADDYTKKPSLKNCIKRFLGYITAIIGIFFIIFTEKKTAIHDKIANTIVIKS